MNENRSNYKHFINPALESDSFPREYKFILLDTLDSIKEVLSKPVSYMSFDTETSGLSPERDFIVGYSFSLDGKTGYYIPVKHNLFGLRHPCFRPYL